MSRPAPDSEEQFSIGTAARLAGVSRHRIRKWEQRYQAVSPDRTGSNRRRYSRSDVARLGLLRKLTDQGYRIGDVARLDVARLRTLLDEGLDAAPQPGDAAALDAYRALLPVLRDAGERYLESLETLDRLLAEAADGGSSGR